jgi:hypothetical protein
MVTLVKHEWHQVDSQFAYELDEATLGEIYPDLDEDELAARMAEIESGEFDVDQLLDDAYENNVDIDWDRQYDDWWTDRKGGYDVTFELGDESSWITPDTPPPPTHKCTKCKWTGQSYDAEWQWSEDDEDAEPKKVCPYCESDLELTPEGIEKERQDAERQAEWDAQVDCFSCGETVDIRTDLVELAGQLNCPHCGEGWVEPENRPVEEEDTSDLTAALEELKDEFDRLCEEGEDEDEDKDA